MSFAGQALKLCTILRIDLPTHSIRLSEGGEVDYDGDRYAPIDSVFGQIVSFQDFTSGQGDEAPAFEVTWGVEDRTQAAGLCNPSIQGSFVNWRVLAINRDTNAVTADQHIFTGLVDNAEIVLDVESYEVRMGFATEIDRFLNTDKGNRLNRSFHRSVWPGETGLDLMTGTTVPVPWGDERRNSYSGGRGGSSTGRINFL